MHAKTLTLTFAALMALLAATLGASFILSGVLSLAASLAISFAKIVLIGMFFMHLRAQPPLVNLAAVAGLAWLVIMFWLTMNDYLTRQ